MITAYEYDLRPAFAQANLSDNPDGEDAFEEIGDDELDASEEEEDDMSGDSVE